MANVFLDDEPPSRAELEHEALVTSAKRELRREWMTTRAGEVFDRMATSHAHWAKTLARLEGLQETYVEDHLDDTVYELKDAESERRDPMGHRGVSWSMFC